MMMTNTSTELWEGCLRRYQKQATGECFWLPFVDGGGERDVPCNFYGVIQ